MKKYLRAWLVLLFLISVSWLLSHDFVRSSLFCLQSSVFNSQFTIQNSLFPVPCSLFPIPCLYAVILDNATGASRSTGIFFPKA